MMLCAALLLGLACDITARGGGRAVVYFAAPQPAQVVEVGTPMTWAIAVAQLDQGLLGLAGVSVDLQQYPLNPPYWPPLDLTTGVHGPGLENFDRPQGMANPAPGQMATSASAFGGTPLDVYLDGYYGLVQVGGAQNTFGMPGTSYMASSQNVVAGVGLQPAGQVIASGSFFAPTVPGDYVLYIENANVNYLTTVGGPGVPSDVAAATVFIGDPVFFTVILCYLDYNQDGVVNGDDLGDYITDYFTDPPVPGPGGYAGPCPDNDYPYDAGYVVAFTLDGSVQCVAPFSDNLGDYITAYFSNTCGT